jgi:hypothetical protein
MIQTFKNISNQFCPSSTVVEHWTHNPKIEGSKPVTCPVRDTMAKNNLILAEINFQTRTPPAYVFFH